MSDPLQGRCIFLHGSPKSGKTTIASSFPGPVCFIDMEGGISYLSQEIRDVSIRIPYGKQGWALLTGREKLEDGKKVSERIFSHKPRTVVVDTVGPTYDSCFAWVCASKNITHPEDLGKMRSNLAWSAITTEFRSFWHAIKFKCDQEGITLLLTCHTKTADVEINKTEFVRAVPDLTPSAWKVLHPMADHIWHYAYGKSASESLAATGALLRKAGPRVLWLSGNDQVEAGSRNSAWKIQAIPDVPETGQYEYILNKLQESAGSKL